MHLDPVHCWKHQQWIRESQNEAMEEGCLVWWITFSFRSGGWLCVHCLPEEEMVEACTMGRRHASGGSVMFWAVFCWKTLVPGFHTDVTLARLPELLLQITYILSWQWCFLMAVIFFSRIMHLVTLQKSLDMINSSRCCLGLPQITIQMSIFWMCWTNKSGPRRPHLAICRI